MADDFDKAQELELAMWEANQRRHKAQNKFTPDQQGYGPAECVECDSPMPEVRRAYGFVLCVVCASARERLRR